MNFIRTFHIGPRLAAGFGIIVLLLAAIAAVGLTQIAAVNRGIANLVEDRYAKVELVNDIQKNFLQQGVRMRNIVILSDEADIAVELRAMEETIVKISAGMDKLKASIYSPEGQAMLASSAEARARFLEARKQLVTLVQARQQVQAQRFMAEVVRPAHTAYYDALQRLNDRQVKRMGEAVEDAAALVRRANLLIGLLAGVAVVLALAIATGISRSIVRPLGQAVKLAETVAAGDLSSDIRTDAKDEPGQLLSALGRMNAALVRLVGTVRLNSAHIAAGASQIAIGNQDLSQRTERQAANLEETAASMEELTSTVSINAETARQATDLAAAACQVASQGGAAVGQVVHAMQTISESSHKIADIISVIDGIAFQTNILALNAAVEAARAGEQGRGFAVVAGEVRSLAQRSAGAAKEIKALINDSQAKVEAGGQQVSQAGRTMSDIVAQVQSVSTLIAQIGNATREQAQGITQVGEAVTQMDQVTQQNAALVEESAAAAESLNQQAAQLVEAVSAFTLGRGPGALHAAHGRALHGA